MRDVSRALGWPLRRLGRDERGAVGVLVALLIGTNLTSVFNKVANAI